jgi:sugar lactone lactonase YvrE
MLKILERNRRSWRGALGGLGLLGLAMATAFAPPAAAATATEVIVLPGASSAEGVAVGSGATFYATELFGGDIFRGNLQHGTVARLVDAPAGSMAVGLKVDDATGLLFVAGGGSGQGLVYDADSGATVATYPFGTPGQSLINDVTITRDGAWFTDSMQARLYLVPIGPGGQLGTARTLTVTGPASDTSGDFNLNGIAATPDGHTLLVGHSTTNAIYTVDPGTGASALLVEIAGPDGILYQAGRLWVAQPFSNQISRLRVDPGLTGAVVDKVITNTLFRTPTTIAIHGGRLAAVNAHFDTGVPPTATQFEIVVVDR